MAIALWIGACATLGASGCERLGQREKTMNNRMYVRNLPRGSTEESVRNIFAQTGHVNAVRLLKNRDTGDLRGFAFVTMASAKEVTSAITTMNGALFEGHSIRVSQVIDALVNSAPDHAVPGGAKRR
jgi:RNA recognition motif-containing protein